MLSRRHVSNNHIREEDSSHVGLVRQDSLIVLEVRVFVLERCMKL